MTNDNTKTPRKYDILLGAIEAYFKDFPNRSTFRREQILKYLPAGYKNASMDRYLCSIKTRGNLRYSKGTYTVMGKITDLLALPYDLSGKAPPKSEHKDITNYIEKETKPTESHLGQFMRRRSNALPAEPEPITIIRTQKPSRPDTPKYDIPEFLGTFLSNLTDDEALITWKFLTRNRRAVSVLADKVVTTHLKNRFNIS